ncbi:MAG TPA: hypothetical protein VF310_05515, partial [Vicinamibacteria bacterium]
MTAMASPEILPPETPATAPPEGRRVLELGLLLLVGFGYSMVASIHHVWIAAAHGADKAVADPGWSALYDLGGKAPTLALLGFV